MSECRCCQAALPDARLEGVDRLLGTPGTFAVAVCPRCGAGLTLPEEPADRLGAFYPSGYSAHEPTRGPLALASAAIQTWIRWLTLRSPPFDAWRAGRPAGSWTWAAGAGRSAVG